MEKEVPNLEVSKQFQCSKDELFKAWTNPGQLKQWWKPMGKQLTDVTDEIQEGGAIKYKFDDGLTIDGSYEKVVNGELLEYTWNWHAAGQLIEDAAYKLTVKFEGDEHSSSISVVQTGLNSKESVLPHQHGWEQGLQQLHDYLTSKTSNDSGVEPGQQKPPISGYNETPEQEKVGGA